MKAKDSFFENVYDVVRLIPKGRVSTYGMIAGYLGSKQGARMVGWAMNSSHGAIPAVPAHRVVNRNGVLSGKNHFENQNTMKQLLEAEGVIIENDQIQELEKYLWDPTLELEL